MNNDCHPPDSFIELQSNLTTKLIKRTLPDKLVTSEFKR